MQNVIPRERALVKWEPVKPFFPEYTGNPKYGPVTWQNAIATRRDLKVHKIVCFFAARCDLYLVRMEGVYDSLLGNVTVFEVRGSHRNIEKMKKIWAKLGKEKITEEDWL